MKLTWIQALKKWNAESSGTWCVPKKGSDAHAKVKALMAGEEKTEKPKKTKQEKQDKKDRKKKKKEQAAEEKKLSNNFTQVDNANFKRGVELTKNAISTDQKAHSKSFKNADEAFRDEIRKRFISMPDPVDVEKERKARLAEMHQREMDQYNRKIKKREQQASGLLPTRKEMKEKRDKAGVITVADADLTIDTFKNIGTLRGAIELYLRNRNQRLTNLIKATGNKLKEIIKKYSIPLPELKKWYNLKLGVEIDEVAPARRR